jgi:hypothetical protein
MQKANRKRAVEPRFESASGRVPPTQLELIFPNRAGDDYRRESAIMQSIRNIVVELQQISQLMQKQNPGD